MTGGSGGSLSHTFAQALRADKVSWLLTLSDLANLLRLPVDTTAKS